jgi:hypothetical protein
MEPSSRQAAGARRKGVSFFRSRGKLIGAVIMRKAGSASPKTTIHLARELRDITVRQQ